LNNGGKCTLSVTNILSSSGEFLVPQVLSYPLAIEGGDSLQVPIRFQPSSFGPKSATVTVNSDDPAGPRIMAVSGNVPSGQLAVAGSTVFGGIKCGRRPQRTVSVCNVGDCNLHVTEIAFKHERRHFRLINNPFPATLRPGSCLNVVIQYRATERVPKPCELVIKSDDPSTPIRCVEVIAFTVWDCCEEHRRECCEGNRRECCEEHRRECRNEDRKEGHEEHRRECRDDDEDET
jgi:hypothetical protein